MLFSVFSSLVTEDQKGYWRDYVACDLHGEMMPELRSGARRSKRLGDLQPTPQPVDQVENWLLPAQNKTRRRVGGGRGRGGNAPVANGPSAAKLVRTTVGGRGRGIRSIDLDPEPPCEVLPEAFAVGVGEPVLNRVGVADIAMEGGSADKMMGVEEEASTTPIPERVTSFLFSYLWCVLGYVIYQEYKLDTSNMASINVKSILFP